VPSHHLGVTGYASDEDQQRQQQDGVQRLAQEQDLHQRRVGDEDDGDRHADDHRIADVEGGGIGEAVVEGRLVTQRLADRVGGGQRQDRRGQQ